MSYQLFTWEPSFPRIVSELSFVHLLDACAGGNVADHLEIDTARYCMNGELPCKGLDQQSNGILRNASMDLQLGKLQKTALLALSLRADEASRQTPRIRDEKAREILDALGVDFGDLARELGVDLSRYDSFLSHEAIVARTIMFRNALRELVAQHPDAVCVNLGCGLDDKFPQVDNGTIAWFDVDRPDMISLRKRFFGDEPRCTMVCGDALDGAWTDCMPKCRMTIVCMEGVLEYFSKEQTSLCLHTLCNSFAHGYLVAELNSPAMVEYARQQGSNDDEGAVFRWGTRSGRELVDLEPRMTMISERSFNEEMRKHSERGRIFADSPDSDLNNRIAIFRW